MPTHRLCVLMPATVLHDYRRHVHPRPRLTVLGSINMDLVVRTPRLPAPGETVLGSAFASSQGGKGANQAIAAARAGADVTMIGAIGTDAFGAELSAALRNQGVLLERLRTVQGPSGIAVITVDENAENTIVVAPGAGGLLTELTRPDIEAIQTSAMLLLQLETPIQAVIAGAQAAASAGVPVLLNPSPARTLPEELLSAITILVVNEGEAAAIGDRALAAVPHVVRTLGSAGASYRGPDAGLAIARPPAVNALDTTGAGDAFTGAFAVAWAEGADPATALIRACIGGALATTRAGAGASAPSRQEIDRYAAGPDGDPPVSQ
jgi:ribokinase